MRRRGRGVSLDEGKKATSARWHLGYAREVTVRGIDAALGIVGSAENCGGVGGAWATCELGFLEDGALHSGFSGCRVVPSSPFDVAVQGKRAWRAWVGHRPQAHGLLMECPGWRRPITEG